MMNDEMRHHLLIKKKNSRSTREELDKKKSKRCSVRKSISIYHSVINLYQLQAYSQISLERLKQKRNIIIEKCNQKCRDKEKSKH